MFLNDLLYLSHQNFIYIINIKKCSFAGYQVIVNYNSNKEKALQTLNSLKANKHNIFKASINLN